MASFVPIREEGPARRFAISPDRFFTIGFFFSIVAYVATLSLLSYSTFDMAHDPVTRMYSILHPCILLEYLPGTLFAQPIYDMQIYLVNIGMMAAFIKKILEGGAIRVGVGAFALAMFLQCSAIFQLVFIFNPTKVSVLLHSIPFMVFQIGAGSFLYSELFSLYVIEKLRFSKFCEKHPLFASYCFTTMSLCFLAVVFMAVALMGHLDIAMNKVDLTDEPKDIAWSMETFITTIGAFAQLPLYFLWFWITPRSSHGISFNVAVHSEGKSNDPDCEDNAIDEIGGGGELSLRLRLPSLSRWAFGTLAMTIMLAGSINHYVGVDRDDVTGELKEWRLILQSLPGSAFFAVGWMVALLFLVTYCAVEVYIAQVAPRRNTLSYLVSLAAALVGVTAFWAHSGAVPDAPQWYQGPLAFGLSLLFYVLVRLLALLQKRQQIRPMPLVFECVSGLLVFGAFAFFFFVDKTILGHMVPAMAILIWSNTRADRTELVFSAFRLEIAMQGLFPAVWEVSKTALSARTPRTPGSSSPRRRAITAPP